ncbi:MAG: hypothetical protein ACU84Q_14405 [Gammaproteobacteria bacterium]
MVEKGQLDKKVFYAIWNPMKAFLSKYKSVRSYETLRDKHNHFGVEMRAFMERELPLPSNQPLNEGAQDV